MFGRVAAVVAMILAATTAATFVTLSERNHAAALEQARAEHRELTRQLTHFEQLLSIALQRLDNPRQPQTAASVVSATRERPAKAAAVEPEAAHEQQARTGNALVEQAIATGTWRPADFREFAAATRDLSAAERAKMLERLTIAINANQVRLDTTRRSH
jgi:hypothetical protein